MDLRDCCDPLYSLDLKPEALSVLRVISFHGSISTKSVAEADVVILEEDEFCTSKTIS